MKVIIAGSLAYDRIMNFSQNFSDHILPEKIHNLNVAFEVDGVTENFGGTAGNIVYALNLMGESATLSATIGSDHHQYFEWLEKNGISREGIRIIQEELTAGAYITTDKSNNQITGFNPGAMKHSSNLDFSKLDPENTLLLISPGNLIDMIEYPRQCRKKSIPYIFDPGQSLPMLNGDDLKEVISGCTILIVNDYEFNMILKKTDLGEKELLSLAGTTIITYGGEGSEIFEEQGSTRIPTFSPRQTVDPTGAGDAYRGGLVSGLIQGKDLVSSATLGSVCASFAVECNGTQVYSFTREEFERRMKR